MSVSRKRFRVEQAIHGDTPMAMPELADIDVSPMHREIMAELRAIRGQMAAALARKSSETVEDAAKREVAETQALLETYPIVPRSSSARSSRSSST
jgi:chemotaxis protein CheZ